MAQDTIQLTAQGLTDMTNELETLRTKRPQVVDELDHMRSLGDLKENGAYEEKRRELAFLDGKIQELQEVLKSATVLEKPTDSSVVLLGSRVELHIEGDHVQYQIVDENESDITSGKISAASPIGQALLGKAIGEEVHVESPSGTITYQILHVE